jgi:hypothetical protein
MDLSRRGMGLQGRFMVVLVLKWEEVKEWPWE